MSWKFDIDNDVGHSSVPIRTTLNKDDCNNYYNLLEIFSLKQKELCVNVSREAHGLKVSLVSDGSFTNDEIRGMAKNWAQVEYYQDIIYAELDEKIELLENVTFF